MNGSPHDLAGLSRRDFLVSSAALAGSGLALVGANAAWGQSNTNAKTTDGLRIGLIGAGAQGRVLIESCLRIPGVRFVAVCDIWEYSQRYAERFLARYKQPVTVYEDYRDMLDQEQDMDAVLIATPDWVHAEQTNACLRAGLHVYCEKEMANSIEQARAMVETQHETGRLLQIGHQRRSNPRYLHAINTLLIKEQLLGRITHGYGQWNRAKADDLGWPNQYTMDAAKLEKYGYDSMLQFRNWRWYKKYGGGPIVDLGSHQIDLFAWVWGVNPKSVMAAGGIDYYDHQEWYDNVMCIYEYENDEGIARAFYQVLTTTSSGGFYEKFMGIDGTLEISEVPERGNALSKEAHASQERWDDMVRKGFLVPVQTPMQQTTSRDVMLDVRVTAEAGKWPLPVELAKPAHQPHLENFFDAIRKGTPLTCPGEIGYETAVAVLRANDAVSAGCKLSFREEDFIA